MLGMAFLRSSLDYVKRCLVKQVDKGGDEMLDSGTACELHWYGGRGMTSHLFWLYRVTCRHLEMKLKEKSETKS